MARKQKNQPAASAGCIHLIVSKIAEHLLGFFQENLIILHYLDLRFIMIGLKYQYLILLFEITSKYIDTIYYLHLHNTTVSNDSKYQKCL